MVDFIISINLSKAADNSRMSEKGAEKSKWSRLLDKSDTNVSELKFFYKAIKIFIGRHNFYWVVYRAKNRIMVGKITFCYPRKKRVRGAICNDMTYDS